VVHAHRHATVGGEFRDDMLNRLAAIFWSEGDRELPRTGHLEVSRLVLITVRVTADHDRFSPVGHQSRDVGDNDRLPEDDTPQNVADRPVGRYPHLLEVELLHPRLIWGDGGALDAGAVLFDRVRGVNRDLVIGGVAMSDAEVVILQVHVEIGVDQPVLDELPNDPRHLIAVDLDDRAFDLDLRHTANLSNDQAVWSSDRPTPAV